MNCGWGPWKLRREEHERVMEHDADGERPITMGHMIYLISVGING